LLFSNLFIFDFKHILLILTLIADVRPTIPLMKSKFKNFKKPKEKAVNKKEPVEKEEVLVIICIGGIILTAMNDRIFY
jgi:hypothetical protein